MINESNVSKVVLREERKKGDYRYLGAEIKSSGNLVFEGQDLGQSVEALYGAMEYEWYWTVKKENIGIFEKALGSSGNVLESLQNMFSGKNASGILEFMQDNEIPFESWSRIGD